MLIYRLETTLTPFVYHKSMPTRCHVGDIGPSVTSYNLRKLAN